MAVNHQLGLVVIRVKLLWF